ncbi:MAG TPA: hypothetical protein VKA13_07575, partial [Gammaproteobacteria bacterium]|nr:hypothetical protein [Gammaproteobacteria bacterium]
SLYLHARDWQTAVPLILRQAPQLLAQGRGQTLAGWIRQLPEEKVGTDPWLLYWQGMGGQFLEPDKARTGLGRAYAGFEAEKNITGQLLAVSGIIDIVYVMRASLLSAAPWLEVLQAHLETEPRFPSPAMEARVLSSLLSMLELMRPGDPRLCHYAERLATLLEADLDVNEKMVMAGRLAIYHAVINGDAEACERILLQAQSLQDSPGLTVASGFVWRVSSVLPYLFADCRTAAAQEPVDWLLGMVRHGTLRAMLDDNNLSPLEFIMSYYAVLVHLHSGNVDAAGSLLERMAALVPSSQSIDMAIFMMVKCLHARARGDLPLAQKYGQDSLGVHAAVGATISRLEVCCIMAIMCCERGEPGEAFEYLASPKESGVGDSPRMRFHVPLIESYAYLMQQQTELCHARLREALAEGSARRYWGSGFWVDRILPRLCSEALRADIEVEYVRQLICGRGLAPEDAADEYWHWPVRVYTLGRFRLHINDQPFDVHTRGQSKPLQLLQVLVALGGTGVRREQLAEVLWPDAEADAALFTLTTTLARLRKMIGQTAVRVKNGRLSLNEKLCWVDARAVEYHLGDAHRNDGGGAETGDCGLLDRVMTLYQGPFLNDEDGGWVEPMRERMRSKFARFVARCCRSLDETGEADRASGIRRRALEIDPGCREFLQDIPPSDALGQ